MTDDAIPAERIPAERRRVWTTPANVALCAEDDIPDPGSRGFVLKIGDGWFHGFVVRKGGEIAGWVDRCPHAGFPIAVEADRYLTPDGSLILCGWHGAVFDPIGGKCVGGPCAGGKLSPWPVQAVNGIIRTAAPAD
jgi:nitrite reductase/ring-hydroxylating ferredoxin subunit